MEIKLSNKIEILDKKIKLKWDMIRKEEWKKRKLENNNLYHSDIKSFMNYFMKDRNSKGSIYKVPIEMIKKYEINQDNNKEQINEYVKKYFTELFKSNKINQIKNKEWDKYYSNMINKDNENLSQYISIDEVHKIVKKLKNGKSGGFDGIVNELIKFSPISLIIKLTKLYNLCLMKEKIPEVWKLSLIRMLLKDKSNVNLASNYRGIALLPITYKIYSTIITNQLYTVEERNN